MHALPVVGSVATSSVLIAMIVDELKKMDEASYPCAAEIIRQARVRRKLARLRPAPPSPN